MPLPNPFWRAAVLALAWCLVGLGIDPGPDAKPASTANAQRAAYVPGQFAGDCAGTDRSHPATRGTSGR